MESPNPKFALYYDTNECARTNTLLLSLSEVSTGAVSLRRRGGAPRNCAKLILLGKTMVEGWLTLVDSFPARTEGVRSTLGVIAEFIPSQGGWCLWGRIELWCRITGKCRHNVLSSRRGPDTIEKYHRPKAGFLGQLLSCQNAGVEFLLQQSHFICFHRFEEGGDGGHGPVGW